MITLTGHMIKALAEHAGMTIKDDQSDEELDYEYTIRDGRAELVREDDLTVSRYPFLVVDEDGDASEVFPLGERVENFPADHIPERKEYKVVCDESNNPPIEAQGETQDA